MQRKSKKVFLEAAEKYNSKKRASEADVLPRVFGLKLSVVIQSSPNEIANAFMECSQRPLWEPCLNSVTKKAFRGNTLEI